MKRNNLTFANFLKGGVKISNKMKESVKTTLTSEDNLVKKFNLKEARVNLTPCDKVTGQPCEDESALITGSEADVSNDSNKNNIIYVTSDYITGDLINIFCSPQEDGTGNQVDTLRVLLPSEVVNVDGMMILPQGDTGLQTIIVPINQTEFVSNDCLFLPIGSESNIQMVRGEAVSSDLSERMLMMTDSCVSINGSNCLHFGSENGSNILLTCEATLQNDVMLGSRSVDNTFKSTDDDDLVGELRTFLPQRNESLNDVANDLSHSEFGLEWHVGDLEWSLEQTPANETSHYNEVDKLNEEFSKKMREEFAASFVKNSLIELKKKMSNIKCTKKKLMTSESESNEEACKKASNNVEQANSDGGLKSCDRSEDVSVERESHKRKSLVGNEPSNKKIKRDVSSENKQKNTSKENVNIDKKKYFEQFEEKLKLQKVKKPDEKKKKKKKIEKAEKKKFENFRKKSTDAKKERCRGPNCKKEAEDGTVFCSNECIEAHVQVSLQLLHGKQNLEQLRVSGKDTERVVVLDRKTGKLLTGPPAPTVSNLLLWVQKHPSFEVLQPKQPISCQKITKRMSTVEGITKPSKKKPTFTRNYCSNGKNPPTLKSGIDSLRISARKHIQLILLSNVNENVMVTTAEVKQLAIDLEDEMFRQHNSADKLYQQHYRGVVKLLKRGSDEVLNGEKSLVEFVRSSTLVTDDILSTDKTTSKHGQHVYDVNCLICNPSLISTSKKPSKPTVEEKSFNPQSSIFSPDVTSTTDLDAHNVDKTGCSSLVSKQHWECFSIAKGISCDADLGPSSSSNIISLASSLPFKPFTSEILTDRVWTGCLLAKDLVNFQLSAYRTSGSMKFIRKNFSATLTIMGRITGEVIEHYVNKIKTNYSSTKEVAVVCFSSGKDEKSQEDYRVLVEYLHSRQRCGVIGSIGSAIKDVYVWPLLSSSPIPSFLTPFNGPGLDVNRGDLLLGIIIQQVPSPLPQDHPKPPLPSDAASHVEDSYDNDDDDDDDIDEKSIITGISSKLEYLQKQENSNNEVGCNTSIMMVTNTETSTNASLLVVEDLKSMDVCANKNEGDLPYDPMSDCLYEDDKNCDEDEEIKKKFDMVLESLSKKPTHLSMNCPPDGPQPLSEGSNISSNCGSGVLNVSSHQTSRNDEDKHNKLHLSTASPHDFKNSNCEAATAALASLNSFLENYIAQKHSHTNQQSSISGKDSNFQLCEITNEQKLLMQQVLEVIKVKSINDQQEQDQMSSGDLHSCHAEVDQADNSDDQKIEINTSKNYSWGSFKSNLHNENTLPHHPNFLQKRDKDSFASTASYVHNFQDNHSRPFHAENSNDNRANQVWDVLDHHHRSSRLDRSRANYNDYWAGSNNFLRQQSNFNPVRLEYNHQKRSFPTNLGGNRRDVCERNQYFEYSSRNDSHMNSQQQRGNMQQFNERDRQSYNNHYNGQWTNHNSYRR